MAVFKPVKQFKTGIAVAASAAQSLDSTAFPYKGNEQARQVSVYVRGADCIIKFGDSTVVADKTITSSAYADLNFFVPAGSLQVFDLEKGDTYYSVISDDGSSTGNVWVCVGYGEGKALK